MLAEMLSKIARAYAHERMKPFSNSDFGNFVHHCAPLQTLSEEQTKRYIVPDDFLVFFQPAIV